METLVHSFSFYHIPHPRLTNIDDLTKPKCVSNRNFLALASIKNWVCILRPRRS